MARIRVHVIPVREEWLVEEEGHHVTTYRARNQAETFARQEARRVGGDLIVHGFDGRVIWTCRYARGRE